MTSLTCQLELVCSSHGGGSQEIFTWLKKHHQYHRALRRQWKSLKCTYFWLLREDFQRDYWYIIYMYPEGSYLYYSKSNPTRKGGTKFVPNFSWNNQWHLIPGKHSGQPQSLIIIVMDDRIDQNFILAGQGRIYAIANAFFYAWINTSG